MPVSKEDVKFLLQHQVSKDELALINFLNTHELETDEVASFLGVTITKARSILTKLYKAGKVQRKRNGRVKWYRGGEK